MLEEQGRPLRPRDLPRPLPAAGQVLIEVHACGDCRTDLHILDGELRNPKLLLVLGHEIVGRIREAGATAGALRPGTRVGVPWLGRTCGMCCFCRTGQEKLCDAALFTGYTIDGGYAEFCAADATYVFPLPGGPVDAELAPLLCVRLIGYRSLRMAGDAERLGIYGFGAGAHIVAQVARWQGRPVFAFTSTSDVTAQAFATRLGAVWAGGATRPPRGARRGDHLRSRGPDSSRRR